MIKQPAEKHPNDVDAKTESDGFEENVIVKGQELATLIRLFSVLLTYISWVERLRFVY